MPRLSLLGSLQFVLQGAVIRGSKLDANMGGYWVNIGCNSTVSIATVLKCNEFYTGNLKTYFFDFPLKALTTANQT